MYETYVLELPLPYTIKMQQFLFWMNFIWENCIFNWWVRNVKGCKWIILIRIIAIQSVPVWNNLLTIFHSFTAIHFNHAWQNSYPDLKCGLTHCTSCSGIAPTPIHYLSYIKNKNIFIAIIITAPNIFRKVLFLSASRFLFQIALAKAIKMYVIWNCLIKIARFWHKIWFWSTERELRPGNGGKLKKNAFSKNTFFRFF